MGYRIVDGPDGVQIGFGSGKFSLGTAVPQPLRTGAVGSVPINAGTGGSIKTYCTQQSPASVAANTTAEVSFTVTGVLSTDVILAINKPTAQAGLIPLTARVGAANTVSAMFANVTSGYLTPTASQNYNVVVGSGLPTNSVTFSAASVAANTAVEQVITVAPTMPTFNATINGAGQLTRVDVVTGGSGMAIPPVLVVTAGAGMATAGNLASGTAAGLGGTASPGGQGATAIAILQGGAVVGVQVTNPGSGYTVAPTVTPYGGHGIEPGMEVSVTFGSAYTAQAGLGLGHSRIIGNGQIAVTFINTTAAALTPTASTVYNVTAFNSIPATSNKVIYGVNLTGAAVANATSAEISTSVYGILASDNILGVSKPTLQAGLALTGARCGTSTVSCTYINVTAGSLTPTSEVITAMVERLAPTAPLAVLTAKLTPVSVAANTTAEQSFTLASGTLPFTTYGSTVQVMPTNPLPAGITVSARVSAANTLAITYANLTANTITPAVDTYTVASFQMVSPVVGGYAEEDACGAHLTGLNLQKEIQTALVNYNAIRGY